jgi:hypothetical protein
MAAIITTSANDYSGIRDFLLTKGSDLSDFDGKTPPLAVALDPADSLKVTDLSNFKGKTPPLYSAIAATY